MTTDEEILLKTTKLLANLQEKCWPGYEKKGMKKMFGKMYPNCVKKSKKKKRKKRKKRRKRAGYGGYYPYYDLYDGSGGDSGGDGGGGE